MTEPVLRSVARTFPSSTAQIQRARLFVRETLARWGIHPLDDSVLHDLVLMTSELFTNALLHGAGEVEVKVSQTPGALRLAVSDHGRQGSPQRRFTLSPGSIGGRGLRIVDQLASAWGSGIDPHGGTLVWLEVRRGSPPLRG
jgi:anti-sigma regulatory factor (Ser/Thr protein kinase)